MSRQAKFRMEALNAHNSYRRLPDVPELEYDVDLEASAQEYAEELADADELRVSHGASLGIYGENISRRTSSSKSKPDISGAEVSSLWYRDIEKFDYATGTGRAGNFTQMVWRDTRQFGIGKAHAPGRVVVVAHYVPAGNVRGQFLENVPPPASTSAAAAATAAGGDSAQQHYHHHLHQRTASKEATVPDEMLNYRVKSRQVDMREVREGRAAVVVRREVVEYEDTEGRVKQKLVLERHPKSPRADGNDSDSADSSRSSSAGHDDVEAGSLSSQGSSDAAKEPMEAVAAGGSPRHDSSASALDVGARPGLQSHIVKRNPAEMHKFAKHVSAAVNHHRKRHDAKQLRLSTELCELAQHLAEELAVTADRLRPSTKTYRGQRLGQSLAARVSAANTDASPEHVVGLWYAEGQKYNFQEEPADIEPFGNFTQLVWKASQDLGVGRCVARLPDGSYKLAVVCYYFPTGNVSKEFLDNVLPPKK